MPSNSIRALYEDHEGVLWIGTYDAGLGRFQNGEFTSYTTREGLFNNGVFQILEDNKGDFWMSCNRGIYRVSKQELNDLAAGRRTNIVSRGYGEADGLENVECNGGLWPAGVKTRHGELWFPTQAGVAVLHPDDLPRNLQPPPVRIESVVLDRKPVALASALEIPPGKDNLEIQYTALTFIKPDQVRFRYKLEGVDTDWVEAGSRRVAYYAHLPHGKYTFRVIAANSDGVWNEEGMKLALSVLAPYYETWWFRLLAAMAVIAVVTFAWRRRVSQLEQAHAVQHAYSQQLIASQENERKRIAAELHDSLGQRLVMIKNLIHLALRPQETGVSKADPQALNEISQEADMAIAETHEISYKSAPFSARSPGIDESHRRIGSQRGKCLRHSVQLSTGRHR